VALQGSAAASSKLRPAINNIHALHDKMEDIAWTEEAPWQESLTVTSEHPTQIDNVDDDLERELAFYNQASRRGVGHPAPAQPGGGLSRACRRRPIRPARKATHALTNTNIHTHKHTQHTLR
jgi:hypothetical protein